MSDLPSSGSVARREGAMIEDTGSRSDTSGGTSEPGPAIAGDEAARWWRPGRVAADLPPDARDLAEWLERRLLSGGGDREPGDGGEEPDELEDLSLATVWRVVERLRGEILSARGRGAPEEVVERLHRGLDRDVAGILERSLDRRVSEYRHLLRDVSHDLRSPLNSILFLADTLLNEHSGELNQVQERQISVLYTAAVTLVGLVNDLIDASRLGEGRQISVAHVSFSMDTVLNEIKSLLGPLAHHRGVRLGFQLETVGPRSGDRQLLSRVLINLVTNAAQATGEGGTVDVRVTEPRDDWLRVEVQDDGPGEDVERLRRFISTDEADPYRAGRTRGWTHGLGLTISSRLIRAAGGSLSVESEIGHGTRFVVELPFARA